MKLRAFDSSYFLGKICLGNDCLQNMFVYQPTFNTFKLIRYMIGIDKCNGSCNAFDDLSTKICVPSKTKDINVKVFKMITRLHECKT